MHWLTSTFLEASPGFLSDKGYIVGQIVLFLTFLINTAVQLYRERKSRESRDELKHQVKAEADSIKAAMHVRVNEIGHRLDSLVENGGNGGNDAESSRG